MSPYSCGKASIRPVKNAAFATSSIDGWTGRQGAILDTQVSDAVRHAITGAVPGPNRAVVQEQARISAGTSPRASICSELLVRQRDHDRPKARELILQQFQD